MAKAKIITPEIAMQELVAGTHAITKDSATSMIKKYTALRKYISSSKAGFILKLPTLPVSVSYNKQCIEQLISQQACCGIRVYPAINKNFELTLVIVAIDAQGENIYDYTGGDQNSLQSGALTTSNKLVDEGQMSPPYPAPLNAF
ncbi:hypothetical protein BH10BAC3_BH10BAC3_12000 [soil metagenome]